MFTLRKGLCVSVVLLSWKFLTYSIFGFIFVLLFTRFKITALCTVAILLLTCGMFPFRQRWLQKLPWIFRVRLHYYKILFCSIWRCDLCVASRPCPHGLSMHIDNQSLNGTGGSVFQFHSTLCVWKLRWWCCLLVFTYISRLHSDFMLSLLLPRPGYYVTGLRFPCISPWLYYRV